MVLAIAKSTLDFSSRPLPAYSELAANLLLYSSYNYFINLYMALK